MTPCDDPQCFICLESSSLETLGMFVGAIAQLLNCCKDASARFRCDLTRTIIDHIRDDTSRYASPFCYIALRNNFFL